MSSVVELAVEVVRVYGWVRRRRLTEQELALDVVLEDPSGGSALIGLTETLCGETSGTSVRAQDFLTCGPTSTTLLDRAGLDLHTIHSLEESLRDTLCDKSTRAGVLAKLVNGQHTVTDELCFCVCEVGEHETWAIAEDDLVGKVNGLEVLGLTRRGGDRDLLRTKQGVDCGRFTDVRVSDKTNLCLAWRLGGILILLGDFRGMLQEECFQVFGCENSGLLLERQRHIHLRRAVKRLFVNPLVVLVLLVLEFDLLLLLCDLLDVFGKLVFDI